jgi:hypothetical protein
MGLGIDLAQRKHEVDCLVLKFHRRRIRKNGWLEEDALAEVYLAIEIRNHGRCPFDERKSSFGHYVLMVANQTLSRLFGREETQKRAKAAVRALYIASDGSMAQKSAVTSTQSTGEAPRPGAQHKGMGSAATQPQDFAIRDLFHLLEGQGKTVEAETLWYLAQGCSLVDVATFTGWDYERVRAAARVVRREVATWLES